jgi:hypothetical protein
MPWGKLDDSLDNHPKARRAGLEALGLWTRSIAHAAGYLTDGHIDVGWLEERAGRQSKKLGDLLVVSGLWEPNSDGFLIHDYLDYNPSREEVLAKRAADSKRKANGK